MFVMPANAGIQVLFSIQVQKSVWIPAGVYPEPRRSAGMTNIHFDERQDLDDPLEDIEEFDDVQLHASVPIQSILDPQSSILNHRGNCSID